MKIDAMAALRPIKSKAEFQQDALQIAKSDRTATAYYRFKDFFVVCHSSLLTIQADQLNGEKGASIGGS